MASDATQRDPARAELAETRLWVVKIGSRTLLTDPTRFSAMAAQVDALRRRGLNVVLVSSGAVALGAQRLGLSERPKATDKLQAAAAAGQSLLMRQWEDAFEPYEIPLAQVLLNHTDLASRQRFLNARHAIEALLELGAVPVINENDTVSVDELCFGDNDQLAAMTATLVSADLLLLLTAVPGVLNASGQRLNTLTADIAVVERESDDVGRGGIQSKVAAARQAARGGVPCLIGDAYRDDIALAVLDGDDVGTLIPPEGATLANRKRWIAFTLKPKGEVLIDDGAIRALNRGRSLLAAGIVGVRGAFEAGDAVRILSARTGTEVARGLAGYPTADVARVAGLQSGEIESVLGRGGPNEIVHRNDLVVGETDTTASEEAGS